MSDDRACPVCSNPVADQAQFCQSCGARLADPSLTTTIDAYLSKKLDQKIESRFTDQNSMAREIADKAEDVVWKRLRLFGVLLVVIGVFVLVVIGVFVGFAGYRTIGDVIQNIEKETSGKVDAVKLRLDHLAQDVEAQTKRVSERGGDISNRLTQLDETVNDANAKVDAYLEHANDLSEQMGTRVTELQKKVTQVSTQVDKLTVNQVYPSLGQAKVVTFQGAEWNAHNKKQNEKWINIFIYPYAFADFTSVQIEKLVEDLRAVGYAPLLGYFGIGGPFNTGVGDFGSSGADVVLNYFDKSQEQASGPLRALVLKDLPLKNVESIFVDASTIGQDDPRRFVIENSGVDFQLVLRRLSK